jgi:hypothetical protein
MGRASWWSGGADRRMTEASMPIKLALALGAVKSVVRVIDRTIPPLSVDWAAENEDDAGKTRSMSYTDFKSGSIHVNPLPITAGKLDTSTALDVCVGFGMHEASHSQESRSRWTHLIKIERNRINGQWRETERPAFRPMRIAAYLWNLVEDVRIEAVTSSHWPGFEPYFGAVLDFMWTDMAEHGVPQYYGPELTDKLKVVYLTCRYPAEANKLTDPIVVSEVAWWEKWQSDYLLGEADTPTTIQRALDHLAEDPETSKEMDGMTADEIKEQQAGERVRAQIERLMREGIEGAYGVCITHDGEIVPLDAETAEEVRKLVREELVEHRTIIRTVGARNPPIRVRKPEETAESKKAYVGRPNAESQALRTALVFRNSAPQHDVKLLKSGIIDDEELYRWGMGDYRVFSERIIEAKPDVFMGLLVDLSGSMYGQKLRTAQQLAQLFAWALHDQEGVETRVWGHTGDLDEASASEIYRIWEQGDPLSRLGLIAVLPHSDNYDGVAIADCVKQIMEMEQPQKILVVLSDGLPAGHGYGGGPAANHVRSVVRWAANRGVSVLQLAIDPHLVPSDQSALFGEGNWLPFKDTASLPRQLASVMGRLI